MYSTSLVTSLASHVGGLPAARRCGWSSGRFSPGPTSNSVLGWSCAGSTCRCGECTHASAHGLAHHPLCICTCSVQASAHVFLCVCQCVVHGHARPCVLVCLRAWLRACLHACMLAGLHACFFSCMLGASSARDIFWVRTDKTAQVVEPLGPEQIR